MNKLDVYNDSRRLLMLWNGILFMKNCNKCFDSNVNYVYYIYSYNVLNFQVFKEYESC